MVSINSSYINNSSLITCSSAPLIDYAYNKVFQELTTEEDFVNFLDEKIYFGRSKGCMNEIEKTTRNYND